MKKLLLIFLILASFIPFNAYSATVYYVDVTTGADGDDGLTEGGAWQTLEKAADTATTAGDKVWVKASASYVVQDGANDCVMLIDTAGTATAPIVYEGYTSSIDDNGVVTIDADTNTLASPVKTTLPLEGHYTFTNFRFTGGSDDGFDCNGTTSGFYKFRNCRFDNNDAYGLHCNGYMIVVDCQFDVNGNGGFYASGSYNAFIGNKVFSNVTIAYGFNGAGQNKVISNLFYDNGASCVAIRLTSYGNVVMNNTIDGDNLAGTVGIRFDIATYAIGVAMNNILFDLANGVDDDNLVANNGMNIWDYNLYYDNDDPYENNNCEGDNDVSGTSDPFTDSGARDYTLKSGSEALNAGFDLGSYNDMGAYQREAAAAAGATGYGFFSN